MEKTITVINLYFLKIRDFFKEHKKWNPFENKWLFCFIPVLIGWICAIHYHAMYQTMDDLDMRFVFEGSSGNNGFGEFALYTNILYGKFLKLFYSVLPSFFWYDFFTYFFMAISFFVITYVSLKIVLSNNLFFKAVIVTFLSAFCGIYFVLPQFSQTSAILAISSVFSMYYFLTADSSRLQKIMFGSYFFLSVSFSFLIRENMCLATLFYTGLAFAPFYISEYKKLFRIRIITLFGVLAFISLAGMFLLHRIGLNELSKNKEYADALGMNIARAEIQDKTTAWDHFEIPWKGLENQIPTNTAERGYVFSKADYRMLLSTFFLGNESVLNVVNLKKASDDIKDKINIRHTKPLGFHISESHFKLYLFLIASILVFVSKKNAAISIYNIILFICMIIMLNCDYKSTPQRVWINFIFVSLLMNFLFLKETALKFAGSTMCALSVIPVIIFASREGIRANIKYDNFRSMREEIRFLDKEPLYFIDGILAEISAAPFQRNLYNRYNLKYILMSPLNVFDVYKNKLKKEGISLKDSYHDLCGEKFVSLIHSHMYNGQFLAYERAMIYYMNTLYSDDIIFLRNGITPHLETFKCYILSDKEKGLISEYKKNTMNYKNKYSGMLSKDIVFYILLQKFGLNTTFQEFEKNTDILLSYEFMKEQMSEYNM